MLRQIHENRDRYLQEFKSKQQEVSNVHHDARLDALAQRKADLERRQNAYRYGEELKKQTELLENMKVNRVLLSVFQLDLPGPVGSICDPLRHLTLFILFDIIFVPETRAEQRTNLLWEASKRGKWLQSQSGRIARERRHRSGAASSNLQGHHPIWRKIKHKIMNFAKFFIIFFSVIKKQINSEYEHSGCQLISSNKKSALKIIFTKYSIIFGSAAVLCYNFLCLSFS